MAVGTAHTHTYREAQGSEMEIKKSLGQQRKKINKENKSL